MALSAAPGGGIPVPTAVETGSAPPAENYQLKWHSFSTYLHSFISTAIHSEAFTDVALFTLDGHQILAHRFVLSACSQYLHQVLKYHPKITSALPIMIALPPEITYKTLKILIQYMYSGEATVSKDVLESVLRGGDILKVKGLYKPKEEHPQVNNKKVILSKPIPSSSCPPVASTSTNEKPPLRTYGVDKNHQQPPTVLNFTLNSNSSSNNNRSEKEKSMESLKRKSSEITKQQKDTVIKSTESAKSNTQLHTTIDIKPDLKADTLQFLVIKEEPIDWNEVNENEMELIEDKEVCDDEINIKPEIFMDEDEDDNTEDSNNSNEEDLYTPLTCELCTETFTVPADWVQHVQTHTDMLPAKRQRRGRPSPADENAPFPPLLCDLCQKSFPTPAEWVQHIQKTHTEFELHISNKKCPGQIVKHTPLGPIHKMCSICNKKFPSHASMLIHKRTHTGEKPYNCEYCLKGFNVKSNLLRHLRTLHDKIINSSDVEEDNSKEGSGGD